MKQWRRETIVYDLGNVTFMGRVVDGSREGTGRLVFSDGSTVSGFFKDDELHGKARTSFQDGSVLNATYVKGDMCGPAEQIDSDG